MKCERLRYALFFALLTGFVAAAAQERPKDIGSAQKQLEGLRREIRQISQQQQRIEGERSSALKQLRASDGKVAGTTKALQGTRTRLQEQRLRLRELQQREQVLAVQRERQQAMLAQLVRSRHRVGEAPALKVLLSGDDIAAAQRKLHYLKQLRSAQQQQLTLLIAQQEEIRRLREEILRSETDLQRAQREQEEALAKLDAERRERSRLLSSLDSEYQDRQKRLKALGRDEKALQSLLAQLRRAAVRNAAPPPKPGNAKTQPAPRTFTPRAQSGLPLPGTLLATYGGNLPDGHRSNGWLIGAPAGSTVKAVAAGRVVYADWLKGYGLLLIIDHGSGWMSLYAFNDALLKEVGDAVREGEAVSTVGTSGGQATPALYFELRRNGQPQDPARAAAL